MLSTSRRPPASRRGDSVRYGSLTTTDRYIHTPGDIIDVTRTCGERARQLPSAWQRTNHPPGASRVVGVVATLDRLNYVDDSGHPQSGMVVYGWIECAPDRWAGVLKSWLDTLKKLWREYSIPVTEELHATEYVNGRGRIPTSIPDRFVRASVPSGRTSAERSPWNAWTRCAARRA